MASVAGEDVAIADKSHAMTRPKSAVSHGVGLSGLAGLALFVIAARTWNPFPWWNATFGPLGLSSHWVALGGLLACGVPMVLWSIMVDKVHRNPTTGIDWRAAPQPLSDTLDISLSKLAGLWATWAVIGCLYALFRTYWVGNYRFAMEVVMTVALPLFVASAIYVPWIDTRLKNPKDGAWALGQWLMGDRTADRAAIADHARAWAVKGFYTAFMISIVPVNFEKVVGQTLTGAIAGPVELVGFLVSCMFLIDVSIGTVGYILTMKPLDSHIRSATPYMAGWVSALICYPPFIMMGDGGPLNYYVANWGDNSWTYWFGAHPKLLYGWGAMLVVLTGIYAWATVAFGIRFSNLTHRGILTHGPYAIVRHPAYWSKNLFWWLATLPFLTTNGSAVDAIRNTLIMVFVSGIYFWRAKTEEKHLENDADYRVYRAWMQARWRMWRQMLGLR
jgi:protein-S-isoprenylcysteine O-methyltransferase Ste14